MAGNSGRKILVAAITVVVLAVVVFLVARSRREDPGGGERADGGQGTGGQETGGPAISFPPLGPTDAFDVNDLAILLPLGPDGIPYPEIKVTDRNGLDPQTGKTQGQLWPKQLFEQVISAAVGEVGTATPGNSIRHAPGEASIESWRVVGFRFAPCALSRKTITGDLFPGFPGCVTQVRLVAQPFVRGIGQDVTVHLVYSIGFVPAANAAGGKTTFAEFVDAVNPPAPGGPTPMQLAAQVLAEIKRQSRALGADTNGLPMQPHPGLVKEMALAQKPNPSLAALVKLFVQSFTEPRALSNLNYMGLVNPGTEPWVFFGGDIEPDLFSRPQRPAAFKENQLRFVAKGGRPTDVQGRPQQSTPAIMLGFGAGEPKNAKVEPAPADLSTAPLFGVQPTERAKAAIFLLDNPGTKHNFNVDCVSCHTTTTRAAELKVRSTPGDDRLRSPPGITGFISPETVPRSNWNLRNFGYFTLARQGIRKQPTVSTRTLTEIIDATHLMNDILARRERAGTAADPAGPGLVCPDEAAVWNCTVIDNGSDCFAGCQVAAVPAAGSSGS